MLIGDIMDRLQNRKEARKIFTTSGQLYIAGELLNFIGYDISVKGIQVKVLPGVFLTDVEDFEKLVKENTTAEIFVKDLMLTGEVDVAWVSVGHDDDEGIMLGLEFRDIIYNAEKLWHTRRYYRKYKKAAGIMLNNDDEQEAAFESINISTDGIMIHLLVPASYELQMGLVVKIVSVEFNIKAVAKIAWIDSRTKTTLGLRYLQVDVA